jgi:Spy/CpxP family protein refolding chaperone
MKRTIGLAILATALGSIPLLAQAAGDGPRAARQGRWGQQLADFLKLTPDQQSQLKALMAEHRETMKPLFEEGRKLRERVRELTTSNAPDEEVGAAVKAAAAQRDKIRAARQELDGQIKSLLDDEQKTKYDAWKAARRAGRGDRGPHGGHGRRGPRPDAGGTPSES